MAFLAGVMPVAAMAQAPAAAPSAGQTPATGQTAAAAQADDEDEGPDVVVTGTRAPPGSVIGDIPPEVRLSAADVRSYGVSSIADLLTELAPQTTSGRGGQPVVLLNGRRISGFQEIGNLPTEAIQRVEIFPEEVALKYGYRADQRVVNFVLRRRFRATVAEVSDNLATGGGRNAGGGQLDMVQIARDTRTTIHAERNAATALTESERDIVTGLAVPVGANGAGVDQTLYRTLLPRTSDFTLNAVHARPIGRASASINGTVAKTSSVGSFGLPTVSLTTPTGTILRAVDSGAPLRQRNETLNTRLGSTVNGDFASGLWRWNLTGTYDRTESRTLTDVGVDTAAFQARFAGNPLAAIGPGDVVVAAGNRGLSTSNQVALNGLLNGSLFALPAGPVSTSLRVGASALDFSSRSFRNGLATAGQVSRDGGSGQLNVDLPIASRARAVLGGIGNLSLNGNLGVEHVSDFATLKTFGYGVNWSPLDAIRVIASFTQDENAPSAQQLGNPVVTTPNVRVFDFVRGTTATVTTISGGNPALRATESHSTKLGLTIRPKRTLNLTLVADYVSTRTDNPISGFPSATAAIAAAFPDRFLRDGAGNLLRIDSRPVNFAQSEQSQLRYGFNIQLPLKSKIQKQVEAFRAGTGPNPFAGLIPPGRQQRPDGAGAGAVGGAASGAGATPPPGGEGVPPPPPGAEQGGIPGGPGGGFGGRGAGGPGGGRGGFGGGRFGGGGAGGGGGRLQFAAYHTWRFTDRILVAPGGPLVDRLNGDATGSNGGQSRHLVEVQAGYNNDGIGMRLSGNYRSATQVRGGTGSTGTLDFGALTTADLRIFFDFGQRLDLLRKHPWLRGTRVSFLVDNIANTRQRVTDVNGVVPVNFQPGYVDALGRAVRLSVRKLFF